MFVRSADDANHNAIPDDLSNYKVAHAGDLVINKMKAWQGSLGLAPVDGIVSPAYFVFSADFAVPQYGEYLLRSRPSVAEFGAASDGVRVGQWDLNVSRMRDIAVFLPEVDEQAAIVKYLSHANARIDNAIAAKRRLIALLEEQKRAIAAHALTGGGRWDPLDVSYGQLDGGAAAGRGEVVRSGRLCRISTGVEDSGNAQPAGQFPFFVRGREVLRSADYLMDTEAVLTPGDGQGGVGKVFHYVNGKFQAHQRVYIFHDFRGVGARYFYWYLSTFFRSFALSRSNTVTMESLRRPVLAAFPVLVPGDSEELRIVDEIESATARISRQQGVAVHEIQLIQEFRTRLVSDVVTGQVDVRGIAATLPDAPEPVDSADHGPEDEPEDALDESED